MKHLDGEKCFIELDRIGCAEISNYLHLAKDRAMEQDLRGCVKRIDYYIARFSSFYSQSQQTSVDMRGIVHIKEIPDVGSNPTSDTYSPVHPEGAGKKMYESTAPSVDADSLIDLKEDERR